MALHTIKPRYPARLLTGAAGAVLLGLSGQALAYMAPGGPGGRVASSSRRALCSSGSSSSSSRSS